MDVENKYCFCKDLMEKKNLDLLQVIHCKLMFNIIEKFITHFGERDIELLLQILKSKSILFASYCFYTLIFINLYLIA